MCSLKIPPEAVIEVEFLVFPIFLTQKFSLHEPEGKLL